MNKKIQKIRQLSLELLQYVEENEKAATDAITLELLMDSFIMLEEAHSQLEDRVDLSNN